MVDVSEPKLMPGMLEMLSERVRDMEHRYIELEWRVAKLWHERAGMALSVLATIITSLAMAALVSYVLLRAMWPH